MFQNQAQVCLVDEVLAPAQPPALLASPRCSQLGVRLAGTQEIQGQERLWDGRVAKFQQAGEAGSGGGPRAQQPGRSRVKGISECVCVFARV